MCVSVWFYNTQITECQQLFNLFKKAGSALEPQELVVERRMLHKLRNIMANTTHNLLANTTPPNTHAHTHTHPGIVETERIKFGLHVYRDTRMHFHRVLASLV